LLCGAATAAEQRMVIVPFEHSVDRGRELYEAVSLELEFEEELVLIPSEDVLPFFENAVSEASEAEIKKALKKGKVDLLLRAEEVDGAAGYAMLWLVRQDDGAVVYAKHIAIEEGIKNNVELAAEIASACRDASTLPPLSEGARKGALQLARQESEANNPVAEPEPAGTPDDTALTDTPH